MAYRLSRDRVQSNLATGGHATGDVLIGMADVIGSKHADVLIGSSGVNFLDGSDGNDLIAGGDGPIRCLEETVTIPCAVIRR